jgi:gag-polypeptide of LTR copia-type
MSNNVASLVPILDGANYGIWSKAMKAYLMSLGLWGYVDGTLAEPATDADGHCHRRDDEPLDLKGLILLSRMPLRRREKWRDPKSRHS